MSALLEIDSFASVFGERRGVSKTKALARDKEKLRRMRAQVVGITTAQSLCEYEHRVHGVNIVKRCEIAKKDSIRDVAFDVLTSSDFSAHVESQGEGGLNYTQSKMPLLDNVIKYLASRCLEDNEADLSIYVELMNHLGAEEVSEEIQSYKISSSYSATDRLSNIIYNGLAQDTLLEIDLDEHSRAIAQEEVLVVIAKSIASYNRGNLVHGRKFDHRRWQVLIEQWASWRKEYGEEMALNLADEIIKKYGVRKKQKTA